MIDETLFIIYFYFNARFYYYTVLFLNCQKYIVKKLSDCYSYLTDFNIETSYYGQQLDMRYAMLTVVESGGIEAYFTIKIYNFRIRAL